MRRWLLPILGLCLSISVGSLADDAEFFQELGDGYGIATTFQVALGDLDGDGDLDAVFANQGIHDSRVLLNDGMGLFEYTDQRLTGQGHGVGVGDLDGDGDLDLFITCAHFSNRGRPSRVYFNDGTGTFTESAQDLGDTDISGNLVQLVDIDVDGDLDAFVAYLTVPGREFISHVYLNDGLGVFTLSDDELPFGTLFEDLDLDGDSDAFVKTSGEGYRVLTNDGTGGFEETWRLDAPSVNYDPWSAAFGDIDGDGDIDIFDSNGSWTAPGEPVLLVSDSAAAYEPVESGLPRLQTVWPILADFTGDGALDLFLSSVGGEDQLWIGDGAGQLIDSGVRLGGRDSRGVAVGDLDGDSDLDLFVPVYGMRGGPNLVWENVSGD